jgi:hypothetical protein
VSARAPCMGNNQCLPRSGFELVRACSSRLLEQAPAWRPGCASRSTGKLTTHWRWCLCNSLASVGTSQCVCKVQAPAWRPGSECATVFHILANSPVLVFVQFLFECNENAFQVIVLYTWSSLASQPLRKAVDKCSSAHPLAKGERLGAPARHGHVEPFTHIGTFSLEY